MDMPLLGWVVVLALLAGLLTAPILVARAIRDEIRSIRAHRRFMEQHRRVTRSDPSAAAGE